ncbi:EcsC family protein [Cupriavidus lacunae]|uniref:EcsC family protein n=1 Tax=Cupriavidus lacunae TaxID=2666307 RepID=A0A370NU92_9BURK|nr:EcsC family protein [Cupriavidus lacunae]RDK09151.1 hypothetical protein DN412_17070 [Cupriavidus lacunae]
MKKEDNKPVILRAVELVLAEPEKIKEEALALLGKYTKANPRKGRREVRRLAVEKIISNYSYFAAFSGGATSLAGVIPGLGTAVAAFGGATADAALCMKYQIEMVMAIASVYEHDILQEEEKRLCLMIAGLGTIGEAAKEGGKALTSKAFVKMTKEYLKGATLQAVKEIFKKVGITFTRKAVEKAIPFGVGVIIGFSANKGLTWYVGTKARDFFEAESDDEESALAA